MGTLTSWNPPGRSRPVTGLLYLFIFVIRCKDKDKNLFIYFSSLIFGPKRDEITGEWRKLRSEELDDLYSSPNVVRVIKSRIMRWAGHVARMGESRGVYRVLVGIPKGKRPLGRSRRRWNDNIKMDHQEVGFGGMDWIDLIQDRDRWRAVVNAVMYLRVA